MALEVQDLVIDSYKSVGNKILLVSVSPAYEYKNNQRTETIVGYKYQVVLPEKRFEKIDVKIEGKKLLDPPASGVVEVTIAELEIYTYYGRAGQVQVAARATGISLVNNKA